MSKEEIDKLIKKRYEVFKRLEMYMSMQEEFFNQRNYKPHINRARNKIHELNEILYKEMNIDKKKYAL